MKAALLSIVLLALPASVVGQSICQQATNQIIAHKLGFTIRSVTLRSAHGLVTATAAIPDASKPSHATVFSFFDISRFRASAVRGQMEELTRMIPSPMNWGGSKEREAIIT